MTRPTVFLGGTVSNSTWRDQLIPMLEIEYFNPVVEDWNEEAMENERKHRATDDYLLYVLTPCMQGVFSVAEMVDDSHLNPRRTLFLYLSEDCGKSFSTHQKKSMQQVANLVSERGVRCFSTLKEVAQFLNQDWKEK